MQYPAIKARICKRMSPREFVFQSGSFLQRTRASRGKTKAVIRKFAASFKSQWGNCLDRLNSSGRKRGDVSMLRSRFLFFFHPAQFPRVTKTIILFFGRVHLSLHSIIVNIEIFPGDFFQYDLLLISIFCFKTLLRKILRRTEIFFSHPWSSSSFFISIQCAIALMMIQYTLASGRTITRLRTIIHKSVG